MEPADAPITLAQLLRWQWPELGFLAARAAVFGALQALHAELGDDHRHGLVVFAYGWLLIAGTRAAWGALEGLWRWVRWPQPASLWQILREQFSLHGALCDARILVRETAPPAPAPERVDDEEAHMLSALSFCEEEAAAMERQAPGTPWTAWGAAHAGGCALFVLSYALSGLFWLPQYTLLFAMLGLLLLVRAPAHAFWGARAPRRRLRSRAFAVGLVVLLLLVATALLWHEPRLAYADVAQGLWLGVLLPAGTLACVALGPPPRAVATDAYITLALPTLALLSVTTLTLVAGPAPQQRSGDELLVNATRAYYAASSRAYAWLGVAPLPLPDTAYGLLALALAPSLLWLSVLIAQRALLRTPSRIGSTLAAYVLALLARRALVSASVYGLLLGVFPLALALVLVPELRTLEEARRRNVALYSPDITPAAARTEGAAAGSPCT